MDSINKNQIEENQKDLTNQAAIEKLIELVEKANTCFFNTKVAIGRTNATRTMSVQKIDESGAIWFLSANDSYKNAEIAVDSNVSLYFQGSTHSNFLYIKGNASILMDKSKIKELWNPILKTWFTEGVDDPRISVIKVEPTDGYYWDTKNGNAVAGIKMMIGAMLGKTMDDSIEGKLKV